MAGTRLISRSGVVTVLLAATPLAVPAAAQDIPCPRPLIIPDPWNDANGNEEFDHGEFYDPGGTGFQEPRDLGLSLALAPGAPPGVLDSRYFVVDFPTLGGDTPPLVGGDWVAAWFSECTPYVVAVGDSVQLEPGLVLDRVAAGVQALIDRDPDAVWDTDTGSVTGSAYAESPRVMTILAYDPSYPALSGRAYVRVRKLLRVFVESMDAGPVLQVRLTAVTASGNTPAAGTTWGRLKSRYR